jgi:hypothetical protein
MSPYANFIADLAAWATLGTAVGTAALAAATFVLARKTSREVEAATAQAAASVQQVDQSTRQAEAAERALLAQTQPFLSGVPWGLAVRTPLFARSMVKPSEREDASQVIVSIVGSPAQAAEVRLPYRNVGNGTALIQSTEVVISGNTGFVAESTTPVVPPGEIAEVVLAVDATHSSLGEVVAMYGGAQDFTAIIGYADVSGAARGALRLDAYARPGSKDWYVRQMFWADTSENVRTRPSFGSQPSS